MPAPLAGANQHSPRRRYGVVIALAVVLGGLRAVYAAPDIFLLKTYDGSRPVVGWVMSEKLDGVRGLWDGEKLTTRGGHVIRAPHWFTRDFPPFALDGELWSRRGDFENIVSIVRRQTPDDRWRQLKYHIFEAPQQAGGLLERLAVARRYLAAHPTPWLKILPQTRVRSQAHLGAYVDVVTAAGGEGVVVRDPDLPYRTGRLNSALKVKKYQDAECVVRAILPGKGKYLGMMGAVLCEMRAGRRLKIGTGFTAAERAKPPPIGGVITFKYYGLTRKGNPRFPVYFRRRETLRP